MLDRTYGIGLLLKGIDGVLETIGGILLLVIPPATLNQVARHLLQHELSQDPHDFFANHLLHVTGNLRHTQTFGAVYLLSHGAAKLVMVWGLLKRQRWAYPFATVFLVGFIGYQLYRMTFAPSVGLALLTVFDGFILWLVVRDYRLHRHASATSRTGSPNRPGGRSPPDQPAGVGQRGLVPTGDPSEPSAPQEPREPLAGA